MKKFPLFQLILYFLKIITLAFLPITSSCCTPIKSKTVVSSEGEELFFFLACRKHCLLADFLEIPLPNKRILASQLKPFSGEFIYVFALVSLCLVNWIAREK